MANFLHVWRKDRLQELRTRFCKPRAARIGATVRHWRGMGLEHRSRVLRGVAAGLILTTCLAYANVISHQGYQGVAMAKPALPSVSWDDRVTAFAGKLGTAFNLKPGQANEFAGWILAAADRQQLDPELIASLIQVESSFRKKARSYVGAIGPAQVRPRYWREFCGGDDLADPGDNIHCGAQVFAHLKGICGAEDCALVAYNIGRNSTRQQAARRFVSKVDYHLLQLKTL